MSGAPERRSDPATLRRATIARIESANHISAQATPFDEAFPAPVFVGGMARSGTHAVGRLLSADGRYALIDEARFHANRKGLPDLLAGRVRVRGFTRKMRGKWWQRGVDMDRGLHSVISKQELEAALAQFEASFDGDPLDASRALVRDLLDPVARRAGKKSWVDVSGRNIASAATLRELFPRMKAIHMVRDGRDVAASILALPWQYETLEQALAVWDQRLREGEAAGAAVGPGSMLVMHLEDLVKRDREGAFRRLVEFMEIEDEGPLRRHFDSQMTAAAAHLGRWRTEFRDGAREELEQLYERHLHELHRDGVSCAPHPHTARVPA